ncbi:MAG: hypothetical protein ACJ8GN_19720 [Longimicrobiaceae bacterium]
MQPLRCVVRTREEWAVVRPFILLGTDPHPDIDFGKEMVIVASMGFSQPMFSTILVDGSWSHGDTLVVAVRHDRADTPGTDAGNASPAVVVRVPRVAGPVFFIER